MDFLTFCHLFTFLFEEMVLDVTFMCQVHKLVHLSFLVNYYVCEMVLSLCLNELDAHRL